MKHEVVASSSVLAMPVPDGCTDRYASGWAFADGHIRKGLDLNADAPAEWHEEKVNGFWDRLSAERIAKSTDGNGETHGHQ